MFKGRQTMAGKLSEKLAEKTLAAKAKRERQLAKLHQILAPTQLLKNRRRQEIIAQYPSYLSLSEDNYALYCKPLINNFTSFVQLLPETLNSYFAYPGGVMDHAFERALSGLLLCRDYFVPHGEPSQNQKLTQPQTLWMYALFSAAILHGVGKILVDLIVEIYDQQGQYLKLWTPFDGPLASQGHYYDYDFEDNYDDEFRQRVTILLARQLMPDAGFRWIASDKEVLRIWLAMLDDDKQGAGTLGLILIRADAMVINRYFNDKKFQRELSPEHDKPKFGRLGAFSSPAGQLAVGESVQAGIEFIKWLTKGLSEKKLMINQSPLFAVHGGLLMSVEIFKLFVREHPEFKNWQNVQDSFLRMKVHAIGANAQALQNFAQVDNKQQQRGVVLAKVDLVLPKNINFDSFAKTAVQHTAREKQQAQYLASDGKWKSEPEAQLQKTITQPTGK